MKKPIGLKAHWPGGLRPQTPLWPFFYEQCPRAQHGAFGSMIAHYPSLGILYVLKRFSGIL